MTDKPANIVPFGKYKGQPVEVMAQDRQYVEWLAAQPWFRERFAPMYTLIVNNFQEPSETPEHNALQVLFLEPDHRRCFWDLIEPGWLEKARGDSAKEYASYRDRARAALDAAEKARAKAQVKLSEAEESRSDDQGMREWSLKHWGRAVARADSDLQKARSDWESLPDSSELEIETSAEFERAGVDVILWCGASTSWQAPSGRRRIPSVIYGRRHFVEVKPTIGDDYPAILRQMRASGADTLFLESYTGVGATREQFIAIFKSAGIRVVFRADVDAHLGR